MKKFKFLLITLIFFNSCVLARGSIFEESYKTVTAVINDTLFAIPNSLNETNSKYALSYSTLFKFDMVYKYASRKSTSKDPTKAIYWLEGAALDSPRAQFISYIIYSDKNNIIYNKNKALYWLKKAAENNDPQAQSVLSLNYAGESNFKAARDLAVRSAQQNELSGIYLLEIFDRYYPLEKSNEELLKLAHNNNPEAQYQLGIMFLLGDTVKKNSFLALSYLNQAAKNNNAKALYTLGTIYQFGILKQKMNLEKAKYYYQKAVNAGDSYAPSQLASLISDDEIKSFELNKVGAARGDYEAMNHLGLYYTKKSDNTKAIEWFKKSMLSRPNMVAANALATAYALGKGVEKNPTLSRQFYKQAVRLILIELNFNDLLKNNGSMHHDSTVILHSLLNTRYDLISMFAKYQIAQAEHKDVSKEFAFYFSLDTIRLIRNMSQIVTIASSDIDVNYTYTLAQKYYHGRGVPTDKKLAVILMQKAAESGFADAANDLGFYYSTGHGVKKDIPKAMHYYQIAADRGDYAAMYNLGITYSNLNHSKDRLVKVDYTKAADWYTKSMDASPNCCAANDLATLYATGQGVKKNVSSSKFIFGLSGKALILGLPEGAPLVLRKGIDKDKLIHAYSEYKYAQVTGMNNNITMKQISPEEMQIIKSISGEITKRCWQ